MKINTVSLLDRVEDVLGSLMRGNCCGNLRKAGSAKG
jgi:hypothetical protein